MNYFGLVLSFMVPGIVIGITAAACAYDAAGKRRKQQAVARRAERQGRRGLYILDLAEEQEKRSCRRAA